MRRRGIGRRAGEGGRERGRERSPRESGRIEVVVFRCWHASTTQVIDTVMVSALYRRLVTLFRHRLCVPSKKYTRGYTLGAAAAAAAAARLMNSLSMPGLSLFHTPRKRESPRRRGAYFWLRLRVSSIYKRNRPHEIFRSRSSQNGRDTFE